MIRALVGLLVAAALVVPPRSAAAESTPIHSYADAVRETVWVHTGLTAGGAPVRVAADVIRPRTSVRVPVIMDASPYYATSGRGNERQRKAYDSTGAPITFPLFYDNYFVPRGYAVVQVDLPGTARSTGCVDVGGRAEIAAARAVIDWLNGRAAAYATADGGARVSADWASGAVGMIGKSWDGTIANGVAATGVDGLRTIVPISAISSWYDYYFSQGADTDHGSPSTLADGVANEGRCPFPSTVDSAMWRERDYAAAAANVRASVFAVHGMSDRNVTPTQFAQWWTALPASVERKAWLSQTGHVDPFDFRRAEWVRALHRWFDHYLLDIDNGVDREPSVLVERRPDEWVDTDSWPAATKTTALRGTDGVTVQARTDIHVSGTPTITVTARPGAGTATLSATLVDVGPATVRAGGDGEGIRQLGTRSCWGESTSADSACYLDTAADTETVDRFQVCAAVADLGHHASLETRETLVPGQAYTVTFRLTSADHVVPAGHRLELRVTADAHVAIDSTVLILPTDGSL